MKPHEQLTDIEVGPSGHWSQKGREIINTGVLEFFRTNLHRDAGGIYIFNRFRNHTEKAYIKVNGPVMQLIAGDTEGNFVFEDGLQVSAPELRLYRHGDRVFARHPRLDLLVALSWNVVTSLSDHLTESEGQTLWQGTPVPEYHGFVLPWSHIDFRNFTVRHMEGYTPGEQPSGTDWIKLNTNELPYPPSPAVVRILNEAAADPGFLRKYPHPFAEPLRSSVAEYYKLPPENVFIGNGSDEILTLLCRCILSESDGAAWPAVTYTLYDTLAISVSADRYPVPMSGDLKTDLPALSTTPARMIFLPNPNAPTGEFIEPEVLREVIRDSGKLWVIDEAYNAFAGPDASATALLDLDNVVILRTFSKSHGLAGLRVGYALSRNQPVMQALYTLKDSYNVDALAIRIAHAALADRDWFTDVVSRVISERERLTAELSRRGFRVLPSRANFLFCEPHPDMPPAAEIVQALRGQKILIRHFDRDGIRSYMRISVGTPAENDALLRALPG